VSQVLNDIFIESRFIMEKLRFKGNFEKRLKSIQVSELGKIQSGGTPSTEKKEFWNGDIDWIQSGLIQNNIIKKENISKKITRLGLEKSSSKLIEPNSILVAITGATCANVALLPFEATANQSVISITPNKDNVYFIFQYLLYKRNEILRLQGGSAQGGVTLNDFKQMNIRIPQIEEQEKIGGFLSTFDKLIEKQNEKIGLLKELKKGYLQKMFPKNDANVPEIRFKGFTDAWEQCKLEDLGDIVTGNTPPTAIHDYYSKEGMPWVTPTDISQNITTYTERMLSEKGQKVARVVPVNTILVTCIASIGKNTLLGSVGAFNQQINALVPNPNHDPYFLFTQSSHWSNYMKRMGGGLTFQIVNKKEFSGLETMIPNFVEQKKIGYLFNQLDSLITLHQRKLDQLENLKKGYMQRLFA
jgi:type I restriction enzyme S subunit